MSNYIALYRKYRPKVFSDVVGQDHITKVLKSEIMQDSVSHAYLFCGSRGTGKTTCAKILAKAISCENPNGGDPCGECEKCRAFDNSFDIVEMDAASNNGVDHIRELREKINFLPIEMKRRVYIVDEVHMLSPGAFNALLKTLEEPPEHVMFILATTELNKIPATILSRCKRFDFHRISPDDIVKRLEYVCAQESIGMEKDAIRLIANLATGAMRDALSMLELFVGRQNVTRKQAELSLGVVGNEIVLRLLQKIAAKDCEGALETVNEAYASSKDLSILCTELGNMLRDLLVMKYASKNVSTLIDDHGSDVIGVLRDIEDLFSPERLLYCTEIVENANEKLNRSGLSRKTVLEIMVMRLCDSRLSTSPACLLERISALEKNPPVGNSSYQTPVTSSPQTAPQEVMMPSDVPNDFDSVFEASLNEASGPAARKEAEQRAIKDAQSDSEKSVKAPSQGSSQKTGVGGLGQEMVAFSDLIDSVHDNMILHSMLTNGDTKAYIDGDVLNLVLESIGYFMISSKTDMQETLAANASRILGFNVTLKVHKKENGNSTGASLFPEI